MVKFREAGAENVFKKCVFKIASRSSNSMTWESREERESGRFRSGDKPPESKPLLILSSSRSSRGSTQEPSIVQDWRGGRGWQLRRVNIKSG